MTANLTRERAWLYWRRRALIQSLRDAARENRINDMTLLFFCLGLNIVDEPRRMGRRQISHALARSTRGCERV